MRMDGRFSIKSQNKGVTLFCTLVIISTSTWTNISFSYISIVMRLFMNQVLCLCSFFFGVQWRERTESSEWMENSSNCERVRSWDSNSKHIWISRQPQKTNRGYLIHSSSSSSYRQWIINVDANVVVFSWKMSIFDWISYRRVTELN
jgi:hypothetical protein